MAIRRTAVTKMLTLALATLAACGGNDPGKLPGLGGSGKLPGLGGSAGPGQTNLPARRGAGTFKSGTAKLEITGGFTKTVELPLDPATTVYNAPPAGFAVAWRQGLDTVGIGGAASKGSQKTGATLVFTFVLGTESAFNGISNKGECTIDIAKSDNEALEGTVECTNWKTSDKTIDVKVSFNATA